MIRQCHAHIIRVYKIKKSLAVTVCHKMIRIPGEALQIREMNSLFRLFVITRITPVTHGVITVQIYVINTSVIRSQCSYHLILLFTVILLPDKFPVGFLEFLAGFFFVNDLAL